MFFRKKEIDKQIESYGQDQETLKEFSRFIQKPTLQQITLEDIKLFYASVVDPNPSLFRRNETMKAVRKFFRHYRGENILKADYIRDNPLNVVVEYDRIPVMQKEQKRPRGRPANIKMIKKVKVLREDGELSFRQIGKAIGKDSRQAHMWYKASLSL